ncbi:hypothetical protein RRG08_007261 [Elysia crispata]|uniref:Uncharacterized protein n=1 Tax=Elysia crispata TaxID=231223 RepID=A0AAE0ZT79_9GAST|nr:hypothetical protein RRG08_007261 [Elysia crispata]
MADEVLKKRRGHAVEAATRGTRPSVTGTTQKAMQSIKRTALPMRETPEKPLCWPAAICPVITAIGHSLWWLMPCSQPEANVP